MSKEEMRQKEEEEKKVAYKKTTCPFLLAGLFANPNLVDWGHEEGGIRIDLSRLLPTAACLGPGCQIFGSFTFLRCGLRNQ